MIRKDRKMKPEMKQQQLDKLKSEYEKLEKGDKQ